MFSSDGGRQPARSTPVAAATPAGAVGDTLPRVWLRLGLFVLPLALVVGLPAYLVNAYGLFPRGSIVAAGVRTENAARVNQALFALVSFSHDPQPNILLGDSQMARFRASEVQVLAGHPFSNLSYGGGTLTEAIASFWHAARTVPLERVYFGVSFYTFTDGARNRVPPAEHLLTSPLARFTSGDVLEATWDDILGEFLHHAVNYHPTVDPATFWQRQLGELVRRKQSYPPSAQTLRELADLLSYCRARHITFAFVIPPEHQDVRERIAQLGMEQQYRDFKATVAALGTTYDCDVDNAVTRDAGNFQDPFHTTDSAAALFARSIWSDQHPWCEVH
jgi:hypothetical protein